MKKTAIGGLFCHAVSSDRHLQRLPAQMMRVMRMLTILLFAAGLSAAASGTSQTVTLSGNNIPIKAIFAAIKKQTGYGVGYRPELFPTGKTMSIAVNQLPLEVFLDMILQDAPIKYDIQGKTIFLSKKLSVGSSDRSDFSIDQPPIRIRVTDSTGAPLSGATVSVKNSKASGFTDVEGFFHLNVTVGDVLIVSFIGMETKTVNITTSILSNSILDIILQHTVTQLEEAVINAGYYTVKEKEKTGSIYKVTAKEIENQPVNNILDALQGRVPGLDITPTTGLAGGGYKVRIRGQNSIAAGNEPLYIIDGVPFDIMSIGSYASAGILPEGNINPLNFLDPSAIESIEVLKDADATAIYGSRGANGVILINTKKGKNGETQFSLEFSNSVINTLNNRKLMNTEKFTSLREEAFINDGYTEIPDWAYDINGTWDIDRYTDWQKLLIGNTGFNNNLKLNLSGGNEYLKFYLGSSMVKETSVFPNDFNYKRISFSSSISHRAKNNRFNLNLFTSLGSDLNYLPGEDLTSLATKLAPNAPNSLNEDGSLNWANNSWENPFAALNNTYRNSTKNLNTSINLSYNLLKNLVFKTNLGYNTLLFDEINKIPHTIYNPAYNLTSEISSSIVSKNERDSWIIEPQLYSNFAFGKALLDLVIGASLLEKNNDQNTLRAYGFKDNSLMENLSASNNLTFLNESSSQYRYAAVFGRLNYIQNRKYILNITARRDGSSRFGPGKQYSNFGAIGLAWVISNENFLKQQNWLSFSKLRGSFGISGNDQIGDYQFLDYYSILNNYYDNSIGFVPQRLFNPNYGWEKNKKFEIAFENTFLKDLLSLEVSYYKNISDNQLVGQPLPTTTGFNSINANLNASIENSGWEFILTSNLVKKEKLKWNIAFQLATPRNRVLEFQDLENSTYKNKIVIGKSVNIIRLYHNLGVSPQTGIYQFEDYNNDGKINELDKQYDVDLAPKFFGNFTSNLQFKNWSLDLNFQFMKKENYNEFNYSFLPSTLINLPESFSNHWQQPGDLADYQILTTGNNNEALTAFNNYKNSNSIISDASFIRLKSLSISYRFPDSDSNWKNILLSLQGQNLLTITRFKGGDPEQNYSYLPLSRRISFSCMINF